MQIIHIIDDFLFILFPDIRDKDNEELVKKIEEFYTYSVFKPKVSINDGLIIVDIDTPAIISQESDYRKVVSLSEQGKFAEAKPVLNKLIEINPTVSDYHRIKGQILSEEGNHDEAIDCLIDSLRWDSKNVWALVMMGNVFSKYKKDITTALKYYDQAVRINPDDHISLANIGVNLIQQGKPEEGEKYFLKSLEINKEYPNTQYGLGLIAEMKGDLKTAFDKMILTLKLSKNKDVLYNSCFGKVLSIAERLISGTDAKKLYSEYLHKLEFEGDKKIDIIEDYEIDKAAKIEIAEYHDSDKHIVKFNPQYPAFEHLIMHELVHLDLINEARKSDVNQVFTSSPEQKTEFISNLHPLIKKLKKGGIPQESIDKFCSALFEGLNSQVYNAPIDLFIENFLYTDRPLLRPYQFISLYGLINETIKAVTDKAIIDNYPKDIVSKSKILNIVQALLYKDLYGVDLLDEFKALPPEMKQAKEFYEEFRDYKEDRQAGEEYELVGHWAEDLGLSRYFELVGEKQYRKRFDIDEFLESLENDPYETEEIDPVKVREMQKFQDNQADIGINKAVVMFMVDALKYFQNKDKEEIKNIALEIAMQGMYGYSPDKMDYVLRSVPDKKFSGYHILAYYYVSWSIAMPEMLDQLQLPYEKEYILAKKISKP